MIDPKNESWLLAPNSAVVHGLKHFGRARADRPYCHGHRVQIVGKGTPNEKEVKHFLGYRRPRPEVKEAT